MTETSTTTQPIDPTAVQAGDHVSFSYGHPYAGGIERRVHGGIVAGRFAEQDGFYVNDGDQTYAVLDNELLSHTPHNVIELFATDSTDTLYAPLEDSNPAVGFTRETWTAALQTGKLGPAGTVLEFVNHDCI